MSRKVWRYSFVKSEENIYLAEVFYTRVEAEEREIFINPYWLAKEGPLPSIEDWRALKEDVRVQRAFTYGYYFLADENGDLLYALDIETNNFRYDILLVTSAVEIFPERDFIRVDISDLI